LSYSIHSTLAWKGDPDAESITIESFDQHSR